ncbi:TIGR01457 family HAD-type hydrolase [Thermodesulfobacteriota bacterium]
MIKGLLLDLDGTVYRGSEAVPGAAGFINRVIAEGLKVLFVTNRSNRTPEAVCKQLLSYNIPCEAVNVLTSAQATAEYLQKGSVFIIGEEGLREALEEKHLTLDEEDPDWVVVGFDRSINYSRVDKASQLIRAGAGFIATNPDKVLNTEEGLAPGNGAFIAAIAAASGTEPIIIGKPERTIIDIALNRLGLSPEEAFLVGDNLDTDIQAGKNAGMRTVLILTGVSSRKDVHNAAVKPTWVVENYEELEQLVLDGLD